MQISNSSKSSGFMVESSNPEKLHEATKSFEALFYEMMLGTMRQSIMKGDLLDGGNAEDIYRSMLDSEYAKIMADQSHSPLSEMLEKQLLEGVGRQSLQKGIDVYKASTLSQQTFQRDNTK